MFVQLGTAFFDQSDLVIFLLIRLMMKEKMLVESGVKDWQKEEKKNEREKEKNMNVCTSRMGFGIEGEEIFIRFFFSFFDYAHFFFLLAEDHVKQDEFDHFKRVKH